MLNRKYVLISGSSKLRKGFNSGTVCKLLKKLIEYSKENHYNLTIIHGDCQEGIDAIVDYYCDILRIDKIKYPANWKKYSRKAGHIRNNLMIDHGKPDLVICIFNSLNKKSPGTSGTMRIAGSKNIPCFITDINELESKFDNVIEDLEFEI